MNKKENMTLIKEAYDIAIEEGTLRLREIDFNYDVDKMKEAVESPYVVMPKGMTKEEFNDWMKSLKSETTSCEYDNWLDKN